ncbi:TPA: TDT family transporter [Streptococcus agalactiae]|nr:TDT family transporter [Streptococcus agalactiae]
MKNLEKPPLVMAGLVLGLLALGNLLEGYGTYFRYCLGLVALVFWIFLIKGILKNKKESRKELSNPLIASVFTTFFMAGMILSTYILLFRSLGIWVAVLSKGVWWLSFIALIIHMAIFSWKYLRHFSMANLFPSWSVLYVGIGVASLTAPISGQFTIGKIVFWYGFIATLVLLPFLFIKAYKIGLPSAVKPNITTICAPMSLITAGYVNSFVSPNRGLLLLLIIMAQFLYFFILFQVPKLLIGDFTPGFSAFTFPLVISATSLKLSIQHLSLPVDIQGLVHFEIGTTTLIVMIVMVRYIFFLRRTI